MEEMGEGGEGSEQCSGPRSWERVQRGRVSLTLWKPFWILEVPQMQFGGTYFENCKENYSFTEQTSNRNRNMGWAYFRPPHYDSLLDLNLGSSLNLWTWNRAWWTRLQPGKYPMQTQWHMILVERARVCLCLLDTLTLLCLLTGWFQNAS